MALKTFIFLFSILLFVQQTVQAQGYMRFGNTQTTSTAETQQPTSTQPSTPDAEISEWNLPSLQTLMDAAQRNSPLIKLANSNIQLSQYELTDINRTWLNNIHIVADSRYGSMFNYARNMPMPTEQQLSLNWGAGMSFYMPFSEIFDRKRSVQKGNLKIEQARMQREDVLTILNQTVINAYFDVLSTQKTLAMYNEFSLSAIMMFEQARMDFNANRMTLADYTSANETYLTARKNVELEKFNLMKSIRILEVIVGIELIK